MPKAVVRFRENPKGWEAILEGPRMGAFTKKICEQMIEEAIRIFESQAKHTKAPTNPEYIHAFLIEKIGRRFKVINNDPVANLVEFGAHPGGSTTFTLRYRPLGRAIEVLSID